MDQRSSGGVISRFLGSDADRPTLGLVYGRRRIGKSTLLQRIATERGGFYWEATRGEPAVQMTRLGEALGHHFGVGRLSFASWDEALAELLRVGREHALPVVLDEFGYLLEADPALDSFIAAALGTGSRERIPGRARLVLCGSAMAMMRTLTAGEAPLRGRAGLELVMQPFGFRAMAEQLGLTDDQELAARLYAVIGGVIGYATDMVDHDLPANLKEFDGWVTRRVLSPAAALHHEATTLLAEDPTLSAASPTLLHGILGAIANGSVTAGTIANRLRRSVSNLDPALKRLISAGFVLRHEDPIRAQRPTYALADPFLQFHFAILDPHRWLLRDREPETAWRNRLSQTFNSIVRGPVFEEQVRTWIRRHADPATIGGSPDHVGPTTVVSKGIERQLDVVVATSGDLTTLPSERGILALGEAKAGERQGRDHLRRLEEVRGTLGARASHAKLLLFGPAFTEGLMKLGEERSDVELVDLERLYHGE